MHTYFEGRGLSRGEVDGSRASDATSLGREPLWSFNTSALGAFGSLGPVKFRFITELGFASIRDRGRAASGTARSELFVLATVRPQCRAGVLRA